MERLTMRRRTRRALATTGAVALMMSLLPVAALADEDDAATARDLDRVCPAPDEVAVPEVPTLTDVDGTTHADAITCAFAYGFAQGFGDGTYRPGLPITRGQAATIVTDVIEVARDETLPVPDQPAFPDSASGTHAEAINKLAEVGVISGQTDGDFGAAADITRGQMARIISNTIDVIDSGTVDGSLPAASDVEFFDDVIGSSFQADVQALAAIGVVQGVDDDSYAPSGAVSRGQLASFVMRAADYLDVEQRFFPTAVEATYEVTLSGQNEVDDSGDDPVLGVGEPGAEATATLVIDAFDGTIDWEIDYAEVTGPFAEAPGFHIHEGGLAENGDIVVFFADGEEVEAGADQTLSGTFEEDPSEFRLAELIENPDGFYLNLHSEDFPPGAVRGQLPAGGQDLLEATTFNATMTGENEVDGEGNRDQGELGATATAEVIVDPVAGTVATTLDLGEVTGPFAEAPGYHIHAGAEGVNGGIVVFFATGAQIQAAADDNDSVFETELTDVPAQVLRELVDSPEDFYLNLHSEDFPPGAVRAQLG
ncbi:MAG: CHRD domain-containing protein [Nitriliruptoraceae bacterium]